MAGVLIEKKLAQRMKAATQRTEASPYRKTRTGDRRVSQGGGGGGTVASNVYPAVVTSGGDGVYIVNIVDADGEVLETGVYAVPVIATAYDLPVGSAIIVFIINVDTLG